VELGIDLNRAIEPLPDRQREAFIAVCVHDQEPAVYAAERGIAPQTARNHVNLAKRKLRSSLPDYLR
jgi:DNA-directed RNA polymerase specialized sigma24 family protein